MNRRAFVLGTVMVLLASVVAVALRSFAEAAFLSAYGEARLPWLLVANAGGFALATLGYDALIRHATARTVDLALLVVLGIVAGAAPPLLRAGVPPVVLVVALAAASQVAGLALWNRVAASVAGRDARRMLPRAGAAVTAGGAIAGLSAGALIPRVGLAAIPYAGAAVTAIVVAVCAAQERALVAGGAPGGAPTASPTSAGGLTTLQRRLVAGLLAVAVLDAIVATIVDLQFLGSLKARYAGRDRAAALALFYGGTNAILCALQLAAVPVLLVTRSLPFTAAIHPVAMIVTYAGFVAAPGFFGIAATRTTDQVLRFATSRTSQEVSLSALAAAPRARWKVLLRGLAWPGGAAATALVLLATGPQHALANLAAAAGGFALAGVIAARISARRFQAALAAPLGIRAIAGEDPRRIDLETLERWTRATATTSHDAALAQAALVRARVDASDLSDHLRHDDAAVRAALFEQIARRPSPALRRELRAAIAIEDDERALVAGIEALAIAGDDGGITRGKAAAGLSREVDTAVRCAERMLRGGPADDLAAELGRLVRDDPAWAVAFARARSRDLTDDVLARVLREAVAAPGALLVIASVGPASLDGELARALEAGDPAVGVLARLDASGASVLASRVSSLPPLARAALCRVLAGHPDAAPVVAALVDDTDPEVAHAAIRSALGIARSGGAIPEARVTAAHDTALRALAAHLDARDALARTAAEDDVCVRSEVEIATRRIVARLLWTSALEAVAAGRDPAPLAASARHLANGREADRKRALDVVQEHHAGKPELLGVIERWLRPAAPRELDAAAVLAPHDAWLARLVRGELAELAPLLATLRRPALFATLAGPALAALAERATRQTVAGTLFAEGDAGDTMFVVARGELVARRGDSERRIEAGTVVGELSVLTHAPRAATVTATATDAEVITIDRATFAAAARRSPELVLGLSATLAGWLAPNRPDVV